MKSYGQNNATIDSLKNSILTSADDTAKVRTYNKLISKLYSSGNYKEALTAARQNLELSQKLVFQKGIGDAYNNIGLMHENLDNRDSALTYYFKSLKTRDSITGKKPIGNTYGNIANLYRGRGNYIESLKYNIMSLKIKEELDDSAGMALCYNNIGMVYQEQSIYDDAMSNFNKSLAISKSLNDKRSQAMTYNNISLSEKAVGNYDLAIANLNKAIEINKALSNNQWLGKNYINIGNLYKYKAQLYKNQGDSAGMKSSSDMANVSFKAAIDLFNPKENKESYIELCNSAGEFCLDNSNLEEAEFYNKKALLYLESIDNKKLKMESYAFTSDLYRELANQKNISDSVKAAYYKKSLDYYRKSTLFKDTLLNEGNTRQIAEIKTRYETEKKDNEITLLNKEKDINVLTLHQRETALRLAEVNAKQKESEITLLNKDNEIKDLSLNSTQQQLSQKELETKAQNDAIKLMQKDKLLKENEIKQQKILRNGIIAGVLLLILSGGLLFSRFKLRKKIESQQALLNERKRISNELHDDLGAQLSTARMFLSSIKNNSEKDNNQSLVQHSLELIDTSIGDLRKIMDDLQTSTLTQKGFLVATEELINKINPLQKINFTLSHSGIEKRLDPKIEHNLFRITQELINNSLKYADAKNVVIDLVNRNGNINLLYEDDGIGFDVTKAKRGYGLTNIEARARAINGTIEIDTFPGKGARTIIEIPLKYA